MSLSHSIEIAAAAEHIFSIYADVESWPQWDPDLEVAHQQGPFETGSTGWIKPHKAPKLKTRLVMLEPNQSFTVESPLPLCRMVFTHRIEPVTAAAGDGAEQASGPRVRVIHGVSFRGPLAPLFRRLIGPQIRRALPGAMAGLKRYAEHK